MKGGSMRFPPAPSSLIIPMSADHYSNLPRVPSPHRLACRHTGLLFNSIALRGMGTGWTRVGKGNKAETVRRDYFGVVGLGRVGGVCADACSMRMDLTLAAATVRRVDRLVQPVLDAFSTVPAVSSYRGAEIDGALLCVPTAKMFDAAHDCSGGMASHCRCVHSPWRGVSGSS